MDLTQFTVRGHLQNLSLKFTSPEFIGSQIAHLIEMPTRKAKLITYNRGDQFRNNAKARARGTEAAIIDLKIGEADVNTKPYAVKSRITDEDLADEGLPPELVPPVNLQQDALENCAFKLDLAREINLANTIFSGTWADGVSGGEDAAGLWAPNDATNTFMVDIQAALAAFVAGGVPLDHVRLALDFRTMARLKELDRLRDQIKYTSNQSVTEASLAMMLGIEKVVVGKAIYNSAKETAAGTDFTGRLIWEKNATKGSAFLYYYPPAPGRKTLAALYQPRHKAVNGSGRISKAYRRPELSAWEFETQEDVGVHIAAAPAGYLWIDTVLT